MDLQEQLKNLFPDHIESEPEEIQEEEHVLFIQKEPMICKFEKRKGKATTIIEGYEGTDEDFKILAKEIFGSNLFLQNKKACSARPKSLSSPLKNQWTALRAARQSPLARRVNLKLAPLYAEIRTYFEQNG